MNLYHSFLATGSMHGCWNRRVRGRDPLIFELLKDNFKIVFRTEKPVHNPISNNRPRSTYDNRQYNNKNTRVGFLSTQIT